MPRLRMGALKACHAALSGCLEWLDPRHGLIAPEATRWLDGDDVLNVHLDYGLQGFARGRATCCFRHFVEPTAIVRLQRDQPPPPCRANAAIMAWYAAAGLAGLDPTLDPDQAVARLAFSPSQSSLILRSASHRPGPLAFRHVYLTVKPR
jgi:hypothetical protein